MSDPRDRISDVFKPWFFGLCYLLSSSLRCFGYFAIEWAFCFAPLGRRPTFAWPKETKQRKRPLAAGHCVTTLITFCQNLLGQRRQELALR